MIILNLFSQNIRKFWELRQNVYHFKILWYTHAHSENFRKFWELQNVIHNDTHSENFREFLEIKNVYQYRGVTLCIMVLHFVTWCYIDENTRKISGNFGNSKMWFTMYKKFCAFFVQIFLARKKIFLLRNFRPKKKHFFCSEISGRKKMSQKFLVKKLEFFLSEIICDQNKNICFWLEIS